MPKDAHIALGIRQAAFRKVGKYKDALHDLNRLILIDPDLSEWHKARSEVYDKLGNKKEAAVDLEEAKQLDAKGL